jgi:hypothetical protein
VIRISVSLGSVTVAVRLSIAIVRSSFVVELVEKFIQRVEPRTPRSLVGLDPVVNGLEPLAVQPIDPLPPDPANEHETDLSEDAEVLRDLGLSEAEARDEVVDRSLALREEVEDLAPARLGHGVEDIGCGGGSCHGEIIYPYRNM